MDVKLNRKHGHSVGYRREGIGSGSPIRIIRPKLTIDLVKSMSILFNLPRPIIDVAIISLQAFIGCCWLVVIYRAISLGGQLDILPLPSTFSHYPSLPSASTPKEYWLSFGCEVLFLISLLEVIFSIYCLYLIRSVQAVPNHEPRSFEFMKDLILRVLGSGLEPVSPSSAIGCGKSVDPEAGVLPSTDFLTNPLAFDHPKAKDFRENHTVWFRNCSWKDIYRDNHLEWLCEVMLGKSLEKVRQEDELRPKEETLQPGLEELLVAYEKRVGIQIPEGYNEFLRHKVIRLSKDPVRVAMRPLTLSYGFAWITNEAIRQMMKYNGFKARQCSNRTNGSKYLVRIPPSWSDLPIEQRPAPIIFLHGIGLGFLLYISLINYLTFSDWGKARPILVLVQPHISMQIFSPVYFSPPSQAQVGADMKEVFEDLGFDQTGIELLAHSNGTVVAGWIIKTFPQLIKRCCLLDPVCFALWEGHVCYNFLYSKPRTGLEKLLRFGMAEELGIAWYTRRHFDWPDAVLWPHQVPGFRNPSRFMVVLAGKDAIINAGRVRRYLLDEGMASASPALPTPAYPCSGSDGAFIQVQIDQNKPSPDSARQSTKATQSGGILFDPESAHGQTLIFGHPYLKKIFDWLEGETTPINS